PDEADAIVARVAQEKRDELLPQRTTPFDSHQDIRFAYDVIPQLHPDGMKLSAFDDAGAALVEETDYSTDGGCIATPRQQPAAAPSAVRLGEGHSLRLRRHARAAAEWDEARRRRRGGRDACGGGPLLRRRRLGRHGPSTARGGAEGQDRDGARRALSLRVGR